MERLNYHHLFYFWTVVRAGSISKASHELRVSSPAISAQLRSLEESLGERLLSRSGRTLTLTQMGRIVFGFAEEIFSLGRELMNTLRDRPTGRPLRLLVGIVDVLPKMIAHWLIEPALRLHESVRIVCREGDADKLVAQLVTHELDVVLSDVPINPNVKVKAYSHLLGECGTTFVAVPKIATTLKGTFPQSLHHAPMLLPTENAAVRRNLDSWLEAQGIRSVIAGEFQDYALLRAFGQAGTGVFPIPSVFERELRRQDSLRRIGSTAGVRQRFYAISIERRLKHPGVVAICDTARRHLFKRVARVA
ncbi:MAG TPA: transcriptional activator NhaR [Terriglobales bacterium]|nr:transcriptional activator NhaR [Terriglobales bacterium]